ncbi:MAG: rod shape-determining protein MreC [Pseudomonas sp.]
MRVLVLSVLSIALMVVDARFSTLQPLRSHLSLVLAPIYYVADVPVRLWDTTYHQVSSRADLLAENERLRAEALLTQRKLQKLATLTEQNVRLRELLNSSSLVDERVLVAELVGVDPNPYTQRILINKGERDGVFLGQPVLDATGLMGQVVEVMPYNARVLLITDASHSLPVQVNRNGLRAIASGTGNNEWLELRFVGDTADIRVDDILVSSGLGQRFPAGYPVGRVLSVEQDPAQPFADVRVLPTAQLNRSRYMLLVFSAESGYGELLPALDAEAAQDEQELSLGEMPIESAADDAEAEPEEQNDAN